MINVRSAISRLTLLGVAGLIAAALVVPQPALAQLEKPSVKFSQSWLFQAAQAMFPLAADRGYWRTEGLDVTIDRGSGSTAAVQRVISGAYDLGFADVGTVVKWNAENPGRELLMVYVPEDGFPMVAVALKSKNIIRPADLEGKKVGAPTFDGARQMFPPFAKAAGINQAKINWITVDGNLRETMLVRGEVDAITGFITSVIPSIERLGVKVSDLVVIRYRDYNLDGFGNAVIGTREFIEKHPRTVAAFVKGLNRAMKDLISDPDAAIASLRSRDPLISVETEAARLKLYVRELLLTPNVRENGFSAVDSKKLEATIASVIDAYSLKTTVAGSSVYTDRFLPAKADRIPPAFRE
ncbi:MAG: ABC transporter substrate-binding protein [Betaproteobacteria bacterium]